MAQDEAKIGDYWDQFTAHEKHMMLMAIVNGADQKMEMALLPFISMYKIMHLRDKVPRHRVSPEWRQLRYKIQMLYRA